MFFYKRFYFNLVNMTNYLNAKCVFEHVFMIHTNILHFDYSSHLNHMCNLDINGKMPFMGLSSIICTIGPSSNDPLVLEKMIQNGMGLARVNLSHGTYEYHENTIKNIRAAVKIYNEKHGINKPIAIAMDTKGPEIRTGLLDKGTSAATVYLKKGNTVTISTDQSNREKCSESLIYVDYKNITKVVKPGHNIFLDDGLISLIVQEVKEHSLVCTVENSAYLGSRKGVNLPDADVDLPAVTEKDKADLKFAVELGVDLILASFIRNADGINEIRNVLGEEGKDIKVVAKIENRQGLSNLDEIIETADGIMVARGDLGIEIPPEKVFLVQKSTIARCNQKGKPVICATQMLESMIKKPRATRAEASDVANAILDGADCVMLSGETAVGDYPVECVSTMANICKEAEATIWHRQLLTDLISNAKVPLDSSHTMAIAAAEAAIMSSASAIITTSTPFKSAVLISSYRPKCPIIAVTRNPKIARQCKLHRGIFSAIIEDPREDSWLKEINNRVYCGIKLGISYKFLRSKDVVVVVSGWKHDQLYTNLLSVIDTSTYRLSDVTL